MPIKTRQDEPTLNMTPMIDVMFNLIIFFMVGTRFAEMERKIELRVPEVAQHKSSEAEPGRHLINVYQDGQVSLDGRTVTLKELTNALAAARSHIKESGVLIRGDAASSLQKVAEVLVACKQAGISDLGISVRIAARESPRR
jgi:biopolymer transport protein ExbD